MTLDAKSLLDVVNELQPLVGGKIQRVDVVADREVVLEIRCPGRTIRLLVSARTGLGRLHLVERRPTKEIPASGLQAFLRQKLVGRPLESLTAEGRVVRFGVSEGVLEVRITGGRRAFQLTPIVRGENEPAEPNQQEWMKAVPDDFPVSNSIAERYADRASVAGKNELCDRVLSKLQSRKKKLDRLHDALLADRARMLELIETGARAELLKPVLSRLRRGQSSASVMDWTTGATLEIALDPARSPVENMERFFSRGKKGQRGLVQVDARISALMDSLNHLNEQIAAVSSGDHGVAEGLADEDDYASGARSEAKPSGARSRPRSTATKLVDRWARRFYSRSGAEILVGRGAKENDRLTLSIAKGDDLWFHASGTSGAHVVLRVQRGHPPDAEAVLDAAHLAAHYSSMRNELKAEVISTEARFVRKNKGDPPGRVGVAKSKTMFFSMEQDRIRRLFSGADTRLPRKETNAP